MHVDYTDKKYFSNLFQFIDGLKIKSEFVLHLGQRFNYDKTLSRFVANRTPHSLVLTFIDDGKFEFISEQNIDALCKKIGLSNERIGSIVIDDKERSPFFCKKIREISSAEDALLILVLRHNDDCLHIARYLSPDMIIFEYENQIWLGCCENVIMKKLHQKMLPIDKTIYHLHHHETDFVYNEIFNKNCYDLSHLDLHHDATVFDVGANIGLFSLYCKMHLPDATIYAFEPSVNAFHALQRNMKEYKNSVHYELCGITSHDDHDYFHTYDDFSVISGMTINKASDLNILLTGIESVKGYFSHEDMMSTRQLLETVYSYRIRTKTISSIIDESDIKSIDLIKIDTEGSELDILEGIKNEHWLVIKNFYIEVHGRVLKNKISEIVLSHGYDIFEMSDALNKADIVTLLAKRKS